MEYKNIEELYLAVGVAGAIIVVFLAIFVYLIISNNKKTVKIMEDIVEEVRCLKSNDKNFEQLMTNLAAAIDKLSDANKIVADTVNKLDYYNKDLNRKVEKHDEKADKILEEMRNRWTYEHNGNCSIN